jgi:hypothetical protein
MPIEIAYALVKVIELVLNMPKHSNSKNDQTQDKKEIENAFSLY